MSLSSMSEATADFSDAAANHVIGSHYEYLDVGGYQVPMTSNSSSSSSASSGTTPNSSSLSGVDAASLLKLSNGEEFEILRNWMVAAAVVMLYVIVIALGSVGSMLVILSITRSRLMWTATNVFIANLAVADLFVCVIDLPITLHYQVVTSISRVVHKTNKNVHKLLNYLFSWPKALPPVRPSDPDTMALHYVTNLQAIASSSGINERLESPFSKL